MGIWFIKRPKKVTKKAIIVWTESFFMILDSGFRRNDAKEQTLSFFVTPAKAGVQLKAGKGKAPGINVQTIMD